MADYRMQRLEIGQPDYDSNFWNAMRGKRYEDTQLRKGLVKGTDAFLLPNSTNSKFADALEKESLFRRIATVVKAYSGYHKIMAKDCDDIAAWVSEGESIPIYDGISDFTAYDIGFFKLAGFTRFDEEFVQDASFDFEDYLVKRLARTFGKAEEQAFITGDGVGKPTGIICPGKGAELAVVTDAITADDIIKLFFSLDPEYRGNAVWMMNDETAMDIRSMKDEAGNFLWNGAESTLLGRPVVISNFMPSEESGSMPVVFGDFSYYWIVGRKPLSVRALTEKFAVYGQIGYLGIEFLDGKLIRREAVQAIQITSTDAADA